MEPPKKTLDRQKSALKFGSATPIGAVLLLGGALATAAFVSSFIKKRTKGKDRHLHNSRSEIDGGNQRLELDDDPSVKEIEVDDGVCTEEVNVGTVERAAIVVDSKKELDEIKVKKIDQEEIVSGDEKEVVVEDEVIGVNESVKEDAEPTGESESVLNGDEKEVQSHENGVDESEEQIGVKEATKIDDDEISSKQVVEKAEKVEEVLNAKVVGKGSHGEDHVDESTKKDVVGMVEKEIVSCNELPLLQQHFSCEDVTNINTGKEIEQVLITSQIQQDLKTTEVNQNESSLLGLVVCEEEEIVKDGGVESETGYDNNRDRANVDNNDDKNTDCDNEEKIPSFEESRQEDADAVAKNELKSSRYPSRRAVAIAAFSVVSSISCSWFFGLSLVNLCVVMFVTIALSKIHAYY